MTLIAGWAEIVGWAEWSESHHEFWRMVGLVNHEYMVPVGLPYGYGLECNLRVSALTRVLLKPRKARPFFGRHPWVLDSAIDRIDGSPADGDVVDLCTDQGSFIARGIFNSRSRIHVRLYTWNEAEALDEAFWRRRLESAVQLRSVLGYDAARRRRAAGLQRRRRTEWIDRRSLRANISSCR